jgi:hypothetical protein
MPEEDRNALIAEAYLVAKDMLPGASEEELKAQTQLLANRGLDTIKGIRSKNGNPGTEGSPSIGVQKDNTTPKRTEDEILKFIDEMTPEQRRTTRHIRNMWDANEDPLYDGYRILRKN